mmetsp:Transcript_18240/g.33292  ORF Transcript_18240/g.33292 Transcript_18240/m.33292 type:complete len:80 (+) Transcript_18240:163-402(+)
MFYLFLPLYFYIYLSPVITQNNISYKSRSFSVQLKLPDSRFETLLHSSILIRNKYQNVQEHLSSFPRRSFSTTQTPIKR